MQTLAKMEKFPFGTTSAWVTGMNMPTTALNRTAALLMLFAHWGSASASIVSSQTKTFDLAPGSASFSVANDNVTVSNINSGSMAAAQSLAFHQFDAALGTLTGVQLVFNSAYSGSASVTANQFSYDPALAFFSEGSLAFTLGGGGLFADLTSSQSVEATCAPAANGRCTNSAIASGAFNNSQALGLSGFIGSGDISFLAGLSSALAPRVTPDNGSSYADNATFDGTLSSDWNGSVTVSYTYDAAVLPAAVPEPLSLSLVAVGLVAAAAIRRRR